jgi:hypothetical protein
LEQEIDLAAEIGTRDTDHSSQRRPEERRREPYP